MKKVNLKTNSASGKILTVVLLFLAYAAVSFFATAGILWLINRAIGTTWWSWKVSIGIWLALVLLTSKLKVEMQ
jgi:hypothetical protein